MFLTPQLIQQVKAIIAKHHAAFVVNAFGPDALPAGVVEELRRAGLITSTDAAATDAAYLYGQVMAALEDPKVQTWSVAKVQDWVRKNPIPLTEVEKQAAKTARLTAAMYCQGLGNVVDKDTGALLIEADHKLREELQDKIQDATAVNIAARETCKALKTDLGWATKDWTRGLDRIAITEKHNAMQQGVSDGMAKKHGDNTRVALIHMPDACKSCVRLTTGPDGAPRVFRLSQLGHPGTNVGKKQAEWEPCVGSIHPHCQCQLVRVPAGWGFDEEGTLVPGGKFGVEVDDDAAKSIRAESAHLDTLRKAADVPMPRQRTPYTCGPAAVLAVLRANKVTDVTEADLAREMGATPQGGVSPPALRASLQRRGLSTHDGPMELDDLRRYTARGIPVVVAFQAWGGGKDLRRTWQEGHYAVVTDVTPTAVQIKDPVAPKHARSIPLTVFQRRWRDVDETGRKWVSWGMAVSREAFRKSRKLAGRMTFQGLDISLEHHAGDVREWHDRHGESGRTTMLWPYGYIRGTEGADGEHVDVFIGPNPASKMAYVVHQRKKGADGTFSGFDEDKCLLGFSNADEAKAAYLAHYDDPRFFGSMDELPMEAFKRKVLATGDKPGKVKGTPVEPDAVFTITDDTTLEKGLLNDPVSQVGVGGAVGGVVLEADPGISTGSGVNLQAQLPPRPIGGVNDTVGMREWLLSGQPRTSIIRRDPHIYEFDQDTPDLLFFIDLDNGTMATAHDPPEDTLLNREDTERQALQTTLVPRNTANVGWQPMGGARLADMAPRDDVQQDDGQTPGWKVEKSARIPPRRRAFRME